MESVREKIDKLIVELLHINDANKNKLVDLFAGDLSKTFVIKCEDESTNARDMVEIIRKRIGKPGNTALRKSAIMQEAEQIIGQDVNAVDWLDANGERNPLFLKSFITDIYKELSLKGNNPLFLSMGALEWSIPISDSEVKTVVSPFIIFPIKLIRFESANSPVFIEFVNDDVFINPCLIEKLKQVFGESIVDNFPSISGEVGQIDKIIPEDEFANLDKYLDEVVDYISAQKRDETETSLRFSMRKNVVAISQYNHDELCMYYDVRRNAEKIYAHPLVNRFFSSSFKWEEDLNPQAGVMNVGPSDSIQQRIIRRIVSGESLIIKGPPGTGKTHTITNLVASLLATNKKVLLTSQKQAALYEIYKKLGKLRKFVMYLGSETENQAATSTQDDVRRELSSLLHEKESFVSTSNVYEILEKGKRLKSNGHKFVKEYIEETFNNENILFNSYYQAIDKIFSVKDPLIELKRAKNLDQLSKDEHYALLDNVDEAGKFFKEISEDQGYLRCPFVAIDGINLDADFESVLSDNKEISKLFEQILQKINIVSDKVYNLDNIKISDLENLLTSTYSENEIEKLISTDNIDSIIYLIDLLYESDLSLERYELSAKKLVDILNALTYSNLDLSLTLGELKDFLANHEHLSIVYDSNKVNRLFSQLKRLKEIEELLALKDDEFFKIYRRDMIDSDKNEIEQAIEKLSSYFDGQKNKPSLFDLSAQRIYKKLKAFGYVRELTFNEVVDGVKLWQEILVLRGEKEECRQNIFALFNQKITEKQWECVLSLFKKATTKGISAKQYLNDILTSRGKMDELFEGTSFSNSGSLSEIKTICENIDYSKRLIAELSLLGIESSIGSVRQKGIEIRALCNTIVSGCLGNNVESIKERLGVIRKTLATVHKDICNARSKLRDFEQKHFKTFYTNWQNVNIKDIQTFCSQANDRNKINDVIKYQTIIASDRLGILTEFFHEFEKRQSLEIDDFKEIFQASCLAVAISKRLEDCSVTRNGRGESLIKALDDIRTGDELICSANMDIIEAQCFSRISEKDTAFSFLNLEKGNRETVRKFFKLYAEALLKLKKCFILSPSTVSVLFNNEAYKEFDVAIIDEASQLEPISILSILYRCKQVVIVGDEWQMPPIKHFVARQTVGLMQDEESEVLDPNSSLLSLALASGTFDVEKLACHYRSNTESLIYFSQKRFYDYMKTFPAAKPKDKHLGFNDVYVSNGCCENGTNEQEAIEVVNCIEALFESYFDEEKGSLQTSIGVVAFGKAQIDLIKALIKKRTDLNQKINIAINNFNDIDEKLIFYKTIETVQGQEADHLILSLTYGKNKDGKIVQSFGELNKGADNDKIGLCMFNVAVTRAKSSISVIHSLKADEITNPRIAFIKEYLQIAERFSNDGKSQFVGKSIYQVTGFIRQVADYLVECGIEPERLVVDFGVTEQSIKLPLVVLSRDKKSAELALWCEKMLMPNEDYIDINLRYFNQLIERGWNIEKVFIHDWMDNNAFEKKRIREAVKAFL